MKTKSCIYCGKLITVCNYNKHLRGHENSNYDKFNSKNHYHLDHEDLFCKFCHKECKNKNALVQHECRCKLNPNKIDTSNCFGCITGRKQWNKGLTMKDDPRILQGSITFHKNHKLGLHKDLSGKNNPAANEEVKNKISKTCLNKSKEGTWHTSLAKRMHYNYKGNDLHGKWELYYAQYLDKNHIKWIRNKDKFEYLYKNKIHYYTPDFYLINSQEYIEIKGYTTEKDLAKWKCFPKDKNLVILKYKDLHNLSIID